MFGIYAEITPPTAQLEAMTSRFVQMPTLMARAFRRNMVRVGQRAVTALRPEPGPSMPGITRLMTPRQRRAFFATNGFGGGIPGTRSHAVSEGWQYAVTGLPAGGDFTVFNDVPYADYVEGFNQQPFLAAIGWLYAPPILADFSEEAEAVAISTYLTVADPFAGVPL